MCVAARCWRWQQRRRWLLAARHMPPGHVEVYGWRRRHQVWQLCTCCCAIYCDAGVAPGGRHAAQGCLRCAWPLLLTLLLLLMMMIMYLLPLL